MMLQKSYPHIHLFYVYIIFLIACSSEFVAGFQQPLNRPPGGSGRGARARAARGRKKTRVGYICFSFSYTVLLLALQLLALCLFIKNGETQIFYSYMFIRVF